MKFKIPASLQLEHEELHAELAKATKVTGRLGEAAKKRGHDFRPTFQERRGVRVATSRIIICSSGRPNQA